MVVYLAVDGSDQITVPVWLVTSRFGSVDRQPGEPQRQVVIDPHALIIRPAVPQTIQAFGKPNSRTATREQDDSTHA